MDKPNIQEGVLLNENSVPITHVTVLSPVKVCPGLQFRDTSVPGGKGNCVFVIISFQLSGSLSHETVDSRVRIKITQVIRHTDLYT